MRLKELIEKLQFIENDVNEGAHPSLCEKYGVSIYCDELDKTFTIEEIEPDMNCGCGCWIGAKIYLKEEKDD